MGKELGGGKPGHEFLVDVEFHVGDPIPDPIYFFQAVVVNQGNAAPSRELLPIETNRSRGRSGSMPMPMADSGSINAPKVPATKKVSMS